MEALHYRSLSDLCRQMKRGEESVIAVTEHMLGRIGRLEPELRAYVSVLGDEALDTAKALDERRRRGEPLGLLHGAPIALKDLLCTRGVRTTCGTKVLEDWIPDRDATVVTRLREAGAVALGKVKLTEGAFSSHHPQVEPPRNPWHGDYWTGVSSSGSGVAVAAGLAHGAIGTDTGGSIRFPSAACGLVGIKPSYGRVSRHGVFPLADSLDHVGPMTRSVEDAALMLQVLAGHDPRDPTSLADPVPRYLAELGQDAAGLRLGVDWESVGPAVDGTVLANLREAAEVLRELGVSVLEVSLPDPGPVVSHWMVTTGAECALAHAAHYPARADSYGPELAGLIETGRAASAMDYARGERERERYRAALDALLRSVDLILAPCMPEPVPTLERLAEALQDQARTLELIRFTAPFDYSGHPSITLPSGLDGNGLPLGVQLIGRHLDEGLLVRAGHAFERLRRLDAVPVA